MNNINFINHLQKLTSDRFSLSCLNNQQFGYFYHQLLSRFDVNSGSHHKICQSTPTQDWYLIGTDGCHLCHLSHTLLTQTKAIHPNMPNFYELDLMDADGELIEHLGSLIPILITPTALLCYPFGVMDIIKQIMPTQS